MRYQYYLDRLQNIIKQIAAKMTVLINKIKFIKTVQRKNIPLIDMSNDDLLAYLERHKFIKWQNSYNYLLDIKIS